MLFRSGVLKTEPSVLDDEGYILGTVENKATHIQYNLVFQSEPSFDTIPDDKGDTYLDDDYEITVNKKNLGTVKNFTLEKSGPQVKISVPGYGEIDIRQIPALLHTLPETSPAKQVVKNFICNRRNSWQILLCFKPQHIPLISSRIITGVSLFNVTSLICAVVNSIRHII